MEPLISVIVPVYNVEPYLRQCVDSILSQTYKNLEIILVDDGSPDGCPEICDEYSQKDEHVRVVHKENGGLSDARNAGMAVMTGKFLSFVDSDDMLPADAIETLLKIAIAEDVDLVIGGHNRFEDVPKEASNGEVFVQRWTAVEAMADMLRNGCASWARLYRRELHQPILFPVGEINEDEAIVLQLLAKCNSVAVTNAIVYHYRCRPESITTAHFSLKKLDWLKHCRNNLAFTREKYPQLKPFAIHRYRGSLLWTLSEICLHSADKELVWKETKAELRSAVAELWKSGNMRDRILMVMFAVFPMSVCQFLIKKWRTR